MFNFNNPKQGLLLQALLGQKQQLGAFPQTQQAQLPTGAFEQGLAPQFEPQAQQLRAMAPQQAAAPQGGGFLQGMLSALGAGGGAQAQPQSPGMGRMDWAQLLSGLGQAVTASDPTSWQYQAGGAIQKTIAGMQQRQQDDLRRELELERLGIAKKQATALDKYRAAVLDQKIYDAKNKITPLGGGYYGQGEEIEKLPEDPLKTKTDEAKLGMYENQRDLYQEKSETEKALRQPRTEKEQALRRKYLADAIRPRAESTAADSLALRQAVAGTGILPRAFATANEWIVRNYGKGTMITDENGNYIGPDKTKLPDEVMAVYDARVNDDIRIMSEGLPPEMLPMGEMTAPPIVKDNTMNPPKPGEAPAIPSRSFKFGSPKTKGWKSQAKPSKLQDMEVGLGNLQELIDAGGGGRR